MNYKYALETVKRYPLTYNITGGCNSQCHVHEFQASTGFAESGDDRHNHRFAGVTGEAIPICDGQHVHKYSTRTDFVEGHYHEVLGTTCPNINVSDGKHIHFVCGCTTVEDNHKHKYEFATQTSPSP